MKVRIIATGKYKIAAIYDHDKCPVHEDFIGNTELRSQVKGSLDSLLNKLEYVANNGFQLLAGHITHEVSKKYKIYEFIQGRLRLIYFHGENAMIVVCTEIHVKKSQKADDSVIKKAASLREKYFEAINNNELEEIKEN